MNLPTDAYTNTSKKNPFAYSAVFPILAVLALAGLWIYLLASVLVLQGTSLGLRNSIPFITSSLISFITSTTQSTWFLVLFQHPQFFIGTLYLIFFIILTVRLLKAPPKIYALLVTTENEKKAEIAFGLYECCFKTFAFAFALFSIFKNIAPVQINASLYTYLICVLLAMPLIRIALRLSYKLSTYLLRDISDAAESVIVLSLIFTMLQKFTTPALYRLVARIVSASNTYEDIIPFLNILFTSVLESVTTIILLLCCYRATFKTLESPISWKENRSPWLLMIKVVFFAYLIACIAQLFYLQTSDADPFKTIQGWIALGRNFYFSMIALTFAGLLATTVKAPKPDSDMRDEEGRPLDVMPDYSGVPQEIREQQAREEAYKSSQ